MAFTSFRSNSPTTADVHDVSNPSTGAGQGQTRLWITEDRGQHDCIAKCRDAYRDSRFASRRVTACIADCPGVVEEEGTCRVDDHDDEVCIESERPSAGRTVALVAAITLVVIGVMFGVYAMSCGEKECD